MNYRRFRDRSIFSLLRVSTMTIVVVLGGLFLTSLAFAQRDTQLDQLQREVNRLSDAITGSGLTGRMNIHQMENDVTALKAAIARVVGPNWHVDDPSFEDPHFREQVQELQAKVQSIEADLGKLKQAPTPAPPPDIGIALNVVWTLVTGFLVMFMQAGFALVETGFVRKKNAAHTMAMNFMVYALGMLGYWMSGFAFQMGGVGDASSVSSLAGPSGSLGLGVGSQLAHELGISLGGKFFGLLGGAGFFLPPNMLEGGIFALFLFQMVFMDTAATIPTGAMAERFMFRAFCWYGVAVGAVIYPLYANWVWGGGWLAALGKNFGLGHGVVDFAGSSVVHLCGGTIALVGACMLGKRHKSGGESLSQHNLPFAVVGTFILAFGWFGFNAGSTLQGTDTHIGVIATNTALASAAGAVSAMIVVWRRFGKPDLSYMCNGMLAGLVAITAPCAFVDSWAAVTLGILAGLMMNYSTKVLAERGVDDPVGAISVHGSCGALGILALGVFANGMYGADWNGVKGSMVKGLLYGDASQFVAQLIGCTACIATVSAVSFLVFKLIRSTVGLRSLREDEEVGLDAAELGVEAYAD